VLAALKGERGDGGWLKIDAPKATDKEISLAIMEAKERRLVNACDVTTCDSQYPEWRLVSGQLELLRDSFGRLGFRKRSGLEW